MAMASGAVTFYAVCLARRRRQQVKSVSERSERPRSATGATSSIAWMMHQVLPPAKHALGRLNNPHLWKKCSSAVRECVICMTLSPRWVIAFSRSRGHIQCGRVDMHARGQGKPSVGDGPSTWRGPHKSINTGIMRATMEVQCHITQLCAEQVGPAGCNKSKHKTVARYLPTFPPYPTFGRNG